MVAETGGLLISRPLRLSGWLGFGFGPNQEGGLSLSRPTFPSRGRGKGPDPGTFWRGSSWLVASTFCRARRHPLIPPTSLLPSSTEPSFA